MSILGTMNPDELIRIRERMTVSLLELKPLLRNANQQTRDFFDEWIDNYEFGLAFDLICDFLLQADSVTMDQATLDKLIDLHAVMEMPDDGIQKLRRKYRLQT